MTEVEFVARAIAKRAGENPDSLVSAMPLWQMYVEEAEIAIAAHDAIIEYRVKPYARPPKI